MQPSDCEYQFDCDSYPISIDEVLGDRDLCVAFDYQPRDEVDMEPEGYWVHVFAKASTDSEWEEISHLLDEKEDAHFLGACVDHLKEMECV